VKLAFAVAVALGASLLGVAGSPTARAEPATPEGSLRLRVLTLNMGGLRYPPRLGWVGDHSRCAHRFGSVGDHIREASPRYDIVGLQELYRAPDLGILTCDPRPFVEALDPPADRPGMVSRRLFLPAGERWRLEADGGIGLVTRHTIERSGSWRFTGSGGPLRAARGVLYARVAISGSALRVEAYVVHLSAGRGGAEQRRRELRALSEVIAANSGSSGNPVLILGDFNVDGTPGVSAEYDRMVELLRQPRDLWREANPTLEGYTFDCRGNALAAMRKCDDQARIDYVLVATHPEFTRSRYTVTVDEGGVRLVGWRTRDAEMLPVSDHYGEEAFLGFRASKK